MIQPPFENMGISARISVLKYRMKRPRKTEPVSSSIIKYRADMGILQYRHFRPRISQEIRGILS